MKTLKKLSVENVAAAIEADAGQALPGLREALAEAKAGQAGRVHTPEQIVARRRGRPAGSVWLTTITLAGRRQLSWPVEADAG